MKAPGFGDRRKAMLGDIAVLTGGTLISEDLGIKLESLQLEHLGRANTRLNVVKGIFDRTFAAGDFVRAVEDVDLPRKHLQRVEHR